jgi:arylsulfatase A-like enzyme
MRNRSMPVMHMDIVPTLLGAAGIRYDDPRPHAIDLTARGVPARTRITQVRAGVAIDVDVLEREAGLPRNKVAMPEELQVLLRNNSRAGHQFGNAG